MGVVNKNITAFGCEIAVKESQEKFQNMFLFCSMTIFFPVRFNIVCLLKVHLNTQRMQTCFLKIGPLSLVKKRVCLQKRGLYVDSQ